jgi:hypothetical protein
MRAHRFSRLTRLICSIVVALVLATSAPAAAAQSLVPARGEVTVTAIYQQGLVTDHLTSTGTRDVGRIRSQGMVLDFGIGLGGKVGVSLAVPFYRSQYTGELPHKPVPGDEQIHPTFQYLDDGAYHGAWQDSRFEMRYDLASLGGVAIAPFASVIVPTHEYEYFAHAAAGRLVKELQIGVYAARLLDPWLPGAFVMGRFAHGFEEEIAGYERRRSVLSLEGGYFITQSLRAYGLAFGQVTHGGAEFIGLPFVQFGSPLYIQHDRIYRENLLNFGAGAGYEITRSLGVFGSVIRTVDGSNGHAMAYHMSVGASFSFGVARPRTGPNGAPPAATSACPNHDHAREQEQLARCICLRK